MTHIWVILYQLTSVCQSFILVIYLLHILQYLYICVMHIRVNTKTYSTNKVLETNNKKQIKLKIRIMKKQIM